MSNNDKYYELLVRGIHLGITAPDAATSAIIWPKVLDISRKMTAKDMGLAFQTALLRHKEYGSVLTYYNSLKAQETKEDNS
tara:strand:+ start:82 stop:324 length:243 start_codon:yes stop_codon:yes gene_type:complete